MTIVYIIGGLLLAYLAYKVWRIFFKKEYKSLCSGCPSVRKCGSVGKPHGSCSGQSCDCMEKK